MNELSGQTPERMTEADVIRLGFCPHCHCPESRVLKTRKLEATVSRLVRGRKVRATRMRIIRYRECAHCGAHFRTIEEAG